MLPEQTIKNIRKNLFEAHYANFEENCFLQAWDVHMLLSTESEHLALSAKFEKEIADLKDKIKGIESNKDKVSREQTRHLKDVLKARELSFNHLKISRSDQYKVINDRADKINEVREKLTMRQTFDGFIPKLPFIEIEGTRFEAEADNSIKLSEKGEKVLYLNNDKTGTIKAA